MNRQTRSPRLLDFYVERKLDLDGMITNTYSLAEVPKVFAGLQADVNALDVIFYDRRCSLASVQS